MESSGAAMKVHISPGMYERVMHEPFDFQFDSETETYFVKRARDFSVANRRQFVRQF
jgi:hypothetical protein